MSKPPNILSAEWAAWEDVRRDVFQLVAWGYQLMESEIRQRHLEEDITGLLREGIDKKLNSDCPESFLLYVPINEDPVDNTGSFGKDRPRIDIAIVRSGRSPRIRYCLEAKRCAKNENTIGWYAKGIRSFVERHYARDFPEGGLLGLVQSDTPRLWKSKLKKKLSSDLSLVTLSPLADINLTDDLPEMSVSYHTRTDGSAIALCHAFLDCNP